tara:strand:- start:2087 stop:2677 length:591 start_codon:yes stop_codon:yes gene_type:complete
MSALRPGLIWNMYQENNPIPENKLENVVWESTDVVTPTMSEIEEYHTNVFKPNIIITKLRKKRNNLLTTTDWTQTNDIIMENESEWNEYRRALRDLPSTTEDPENPIWPDPPKVEITNKIITKTQLEGELQTTRTQLEGDLQTTRTELQTTRTQLEGDLQVEKTENEITRLKLANAQNRISILEQSLSSILSKLNI